MSYKGYVKSIFFLKKYIFFLGQADDKGNVSEDISLSTGGKVLLAVTSPIWVPLGTVATVLALPFAVGFFIKDNVAVGKFMKNIPMFMRKWTDDVLIVCSTNEKVREFVREHYWPLFKTGISKLFTDYFPRMTAVDKSKMDRIGDYIELLEEKLRKLRALQERLLEIRKDVILFRRQCDKNATNII